MTFFTTWQAQFLFYKMEKQTLIMNIGKPPRPATRADTTNRVKTVHEILKKWLKTANGKSYQSLLCKLWMTKDSQNREATNFKGKIYQYLFDFHKCIKFAYYYYIC